MTALSGADGSRFSLSLAAALLFAAVSPLAAEPAVPPPGTILGSDSGRALREIPHDEGEGGHQSELGALGNLAVEWPQIFGDPARNAEISCGTCGSTAAILLTSHGGSE